MIPWIRNNMCLKKPKLLLAVCQCEQLILIPGGSSTRATASNPLRVVRIPGWMVENCEAQRSRSGAARKKAQTFQPESAWFSAVLERVICIVAGLLIRNSVRGSPSKCTVQHKFFYRSAVPGENVPGIHFDDQYAREGPRPDREDLPGDLDHSDVHAGGNIHPQCYLELLKHSWHHPIRWIGNSCSRVWSYSQTFPKTEGRTMRCEVRMQWGLTKASVAVSPLQVVVSSPS